MKTLLRRPRRPRRWHSPGIPESAIPHVVYASSWSNLDQLYRRPPLQ